MNNISVPTLVLILTAVGSEDMPAVFDKMMEQAGFSPAERKKNLDESFLGVQNKSLCNIGDSKDAKNSLKHSKSSRVIRALFDKKTSAKIRDSSSSQKGDVTVDFSDSHVTERAKKLFETLSCDPSKSSVKFQGREHDRYIFARPASKQLFTVIAFRSIRFVSFLILSLGFSVEFSSMVSTLFGINDPVSLTLLSQSPFSLSPLSRSL